ncbi:APH domain-containing protein [Fusarium sp. LHS14.1]|nr:APH domain-containing protein [Fusarium sp. LHS14.1]
MVDLIAQDRLQKERDRFIETIDEGSIRRLASSYHDGDECDFFQPPKCGRFVMSYFVRFPNGDLWVVRVPISPCLAFDAQQLVEREVVTMHLVAQTTIPIPRVIAPNIDEEDDIDMPPFVILEYVEGTPLSDVRIQNLSAEQKTNMYQDMANIYLQLRSLTFSEIGALALSEEDEVDVLQGPVSPEFNLQQLAGLEPARVREVRGPRGPIRTAIEYVSILLAMSWNVFYNSPAVTQDLVDAEQTLYYLFQFDRFVRKKWFDETLDHEPFVLSHGDLTDRNILVDDDMHIVAVLGWEWSRVVPLQLFNPPLWLVSNSPEVLASRQFYQYHVEELEKFMTVLRQREQAHFGGTHLADEWQDIHRNGGLLVAEALEKMDLEIIFYFGYRFCDDSQTPTTVLRQFIEDSPARVDIVASKVREGEMYDQQCQLLRLGEYSP